MILRGDAVLLQRPVTGFCTIASWQPRQRMRDVGDLALELQEDPEGAPVSAGESPVSTPARSINPWLIGVAGLVLGAAVVYALVSAIGSDAPNAAPTWSNLTAIALGDE